MPQERMNTITKRRRIAPGDVKANPLNRWEHKVTELADGCGKLKPRTNH